MMGAEEIFEISDLLLVVGAAGVHALDDGRHVSEHHGVHQCCNECVGGIYVLSQFANVKAHGNS